MHPFSEAKLKHPEPPVGSRAVPRSAPYLIGVQNGAAPELCERHAAESGALARLFGDAAARDTPGEFSNAFACRLTLEPFREPATTPSGLSYERSALLNHLKSVSG